FILRFFLNSTAPPSVFTLSLHDALPISGAARHYLFVRAIHTGNGRLRKGQSLMPRRTDLETILIIGAGPIVIGQACEFDYSGAQDRKSTRLNSSHVSISYAVFCLKTTKK